MFKRYGSTYVNDNYDVIVIDPHWFICASRWCADQDLNSKKRGQTLQEYAWEVGQQEATAGGATGRGYNGN